MSPNCEKWVTHLFATDVNSWQESSDSDNHSRIQCLLVWATKGTVKGVVALQK